MTNEQAIKMLKSKMDGHTDTSYEWTETVRMAIKALEQEPCEDTISRQAVHDMIENTPIKPDDKWFNWMQKVCNRLAQLPSVTPQSKTGEWIQDCISRKSIKQKLQEHHDFYVNAYGGFSNLPQNDKSRVDEITNCIAMVVNEPSVTSHPTRWIPVSERVPEYGEPVLTWDGNCYFVEKRIPCIRDGNGEPILSDWWVSDDYDGTASDYYPNLKDGACIAWMPLPSQWKGTDLEDDD